MKFAMDDQGFSPYPENTLIVVLNDKQAVDRAIKALTDMEIDRDTIQVLNERSGEAKNDTNNATRSAIEQTAGGNQQAAESNMRIFQAYQYELTNGHYLLAVSADDRDIALAAGQAVQKQGGHHAHYYTTSVVESILD